MLRGIDMAICVPGIRCTCSSLKFCSYTIDHNIKRASSFSIWSDVQHIVQQTVDYNNYSPKIKTFSNTTIPCLDSHQWAFSLLLLTILMILWMLKRQSDFPEWKLPDLAPEATICHLQIAHNTVHDDQAKNSSCQVHVASAFELKCEYLTLLQNYITISSNNSTDILKSSEQHFDEHALQALKSWQALKGGFLCM